MTTLAKDKELSYGRPQGLLLGDNFLRKEDRQIVLEKIKVEKPSVINGHLLATSWMRTPVRHSKTWH